MNSGGLIIHVADHLLTMSFHQYGVVKTPTHCEIISIFANSIVLTMIQLTNYSLDTDSVFFFATLAKVTNKLTMKTQISNLAPTTRSCNNLHQVRSSPKYSKGKYSFFNPKYISRLGSFLLKLRLSATLKMAKKIFLSNGSN